MPEPPRRCFRDAIREISSAADLLRQALAAHLAGDRRSCHDLIVQADDPAVREWAAPFLGPAGKNRFLNIRRIEGGPPILPKEQRIPPRMPSRAVKATLIASQGRHCAFCGIPLVRSEVRRAMQAAYPDAARWGAANEDCHAALLCMWLQYDHVLPHSRGGETILSNLVLTCAPCNYGRMSLTPDEVGLLDPRERPWPKTDWDGLEGFIGT